MSALLSAKIQSLTAIKTDASEFLKALDAVATFQAVHKQTTAAAAATATSTSPNSTTSFFTRRNRTTFQPRHRHRPSHYNSQSLRVQLEQHGQVLVEEFLDSFEPLRIKLYDLESTVQHLDESSKIVEAKLETVRAQTSSYVTILNALQEEQITLGRRTKLIEDFLDTACLSDKEIHILQHCDFLKDDEIQQFFECLMKMKHIRSLENVLSTGWARTAGLQLVAKTSALQSAGYERLFMWVRGNCDVLGSKAALEGSLTSTKASAQQLHYFKRGLRILQDTPAYFEQCCVAVVNKQRADLRARFVRALVQGDGKNPPMEIQAHDALRFVGDMLAWVHGTIASEIDHLWNLFNKKGGKSNLSNNRSHENLAPDKSSVSSASSTPSTPRTSSASSARVEHMVPTAFDDMIRPLKVRIQQSARGEDDIVHCYRLCDLLQFYHERLVSLLPVESVFMVGLAAAAVKLQGRFNDLLQIESSKLLHSTTIYPSDLSVANSVNRAVKTVSSLCNATSLSLGGLGTAISANADGGGSDGVGSISSSLANINIEQVMTTMIESIQFACQASASGLDTIDRGIYITNSADHLLRSLSSYGHMQQRSKYLESEMKKHMKTLTNDVANKILERHGLLDVILAMSSDDDTLKENAEMSLEEQKVLKSQLLSFSTQLFRMEEVETQFSLLGTSELKTNAEHLVRSRLADMYQTLYNILKSPGETMYNPDQVKTLLNV